MQFLWASILMSLTSFWLPGNKNAINASQQKLSQAEVPFWVEVQKAGGSDYLYAAVLVSPSWIISTDTMIPTDGIDRLNRVNPPGYVAIVGKERRNLTKKAPIPTISSFALFMLDRPVTADPISFLCDGSLLQSADLEVVWKSLADGLRKDKIKATYRCNYNIASVSSFSSLSKLPAFCTAKSGIQTLSNQSRQDVSLVVTSIKSQYYLVGIGMEQTQFTPNLDVCTNLLPVAEMLKQKIPTIKQLPLKGDTQVHQYTQAMNWNEIPFWVELQRPGYFHGIDVNLAATLISPSWIVTTHKVGPATGWTAQVGAERRTVIKRIKVSRWSSILKLNETVAAAPIRLLPNNRILQYGRLEVVWKNDNRQLRKAAIMYSDPCWLQAKSPFHSMTKLTHFCASKVGRQRSAISDSGRFSPGFPVVAFLEGQYYLIGTSLGIDYETENFKEVPGGDVYDNLVPAVDRIKRELLKDGQS